MDEKSFLIEKISDIELRQFATEESKRKVSVIIQLNLQPQQVEFGKLRHRGVNKYSPKRIKPYTLEERKEIERKTVAAKTFLKKELREPPHFLELTRAFVANVQSEQLRKIARSPLIKAIQPNRRRKKWDSASETI